MKSMKNEKKWAITDLNSPNGSRDIPFQRQEFEQDGRRHFIDFLPRFHLNIMSQAQCCKNESAISQSLSFDLFENLQAVSSQQRNFA